MSNYAKLYWLTRLDGINGMILFIGIFFFIAAFVSLMYAYVFKDWGWSKEEEKKAQQVVMKRLKWLIPFGFLFITISCFVPTKEEAILIVAGGKAMNFVESDTSINKIPSQTTALITEYLDKQLKEIKSK